MTDLDGGACHEMSKALKSKRGNAKRANSKSGVS
jgi:hypothetical protein